MQLVLTPELILAAYRQGLFPMAYSGDSPYVHWVCPEERGQLSIEALHIPRSLKKTIRKMPYDVRINTDFRGVIEACAEPGQTRPETWINPQIIDVFCKLHESGHAHSVECWQDGALVGGLYGLAIGGAFFGESMFSRADNASKVALIHLAARLWAGGFSVLDTQFTNPHLEQFGIEEIPHDFYMTLLSDAVQLNADFKLEDQTERQLLTTYLEFRRKP